MHLSFFVITHRKDEIWEKDCLADLSSSSPLLSLQMEGTGGRKVEEEAGGRGQRRGSYHQIAISTKLSLHATDFPSLI